MQVNNFLSLIDNTGNLPHPELSNAMIMERMKLLKNALNLKYKMQEIIIISNLLTAIDPQVIIHLSAVSHQIDQIKTHILHLIIVFLH